MTIKSFFNFSLINLFTKSDLADSKRSNSVIGDNSESAINISLIFSATIVPPGSLTSIDFIPSFFKYSFKRLA